MATTVSVIVSTCVFVETTKSWCVGKRILERTFSDLSEARKLGETLVAPGMSVTVRPNSNETDADGKFFREWRSFDGMRFQEVRFGI